MAKFLDENFLLSNETAKKLYHNYAKNLPIIDYHCHIQQDEILENKQFKNLTEIWLYADNYKWRAMRSCGVDERYITGDANDYDKFLAWAKIMPELFGNPLYHWTHLELQRYFDIYEILNEKNATQIWDKANKILTSGKLNVHDILRKSNVELICTTDDPLDDLATHIKLKDKTSTKVLPTFRPDRLLNITHENYSQFILRLQDISKIRITNYAQFLEALKSRLEFFASVGTCVSDHGMNYVPYAVTNEDEVNDIFIKAYLNKASIKHEEETKFRSHTLIWLAKEYTRLGFAMQMHMNVTRNNNSRMMNMIGADTGFDAVNDTQIAYPLSNLLNEMDRNNGLPKTILYSLNHNDNYILATLMGCFQGSGTKGKIQLGSGWWFNDQRDGMEEQMKALGNLGAFGAFIGMLTDSRSFLSYTRHEYFRRILCNLIGVAVENGEYPDDEEQLKSLVQNICYYNAKNYFNFG
jgi:glucuronate isomerase